MYLCFQIRQYDLENIQKLAIRRQAALDLYRQDFERAHGPVSEIHKDGDGEGFDEIDCVPSIASRTEDMIHELTEDSNIVFEDVYNNDNSETFVFYDDDDDVEKLPSTFVDETSDDDDNVEWERSHVQFASEVEFIPVLNVDGWQDAFIEACVGTWVQDRERFVRRINVVSDQISWIFNADHRKKFIKLIIVVSLFINLS